MEIISELKDLLILQHYFCVECSYRQPYVFTRYPECNSVNIEQEVAGDLVFGPDGEPEFLTKEDVVLQDCKHIIKDHGYDEQAIGASEDDIKGIIQDTKTTLEEEDDRLVPDETQVSQENGTFDISVTLDNGTAGNITV